MPRSIQVSIPSDRTDSVVEKLRGMDGVVSLSLQKGASLKPPGDVLSILATNEAFVPMQGWLADYVGESGSVMSSEPRSLVASTSQAQIDEETNEASWPEMAALLRRETNPSSNYLMAMFFAGLVASAGLWSDQLHIVIAAMVIAPGFEPIIRVPFGLLAQEQRSWRIGLKSTAVGYLALVLGAMAAVLIAMAIDAKSEGTLDSRYWVQFWSSLSPMSVVIALAAAGAGAAIIAAQRSVLTAGVMIALALVPSASIVGMAVTVGELPLAGQALLRWLVEVTCVAAGGALVFGAKRIVKGRAGTATD